MNTFCFILEEGKNLPTNYLDYRLIMVQTQHTETLKSPLGKNKKSASPLPNLQIIDMSSLKKR